MACAVMAIPSHKGEVQTWMTAHQEPEAPNKTALRPGGPNSNGVPNTRRRTKSSTCIFPRRLAPARPISFRSRSVPVLSLKKSSVPSRIGPPRGAGSPAYNDVCCIGVSRQPGWAPAACNRCVRVLRVGLAMLLEDRRQLTGRSGARFPPKNGPHELPVSKHHKIPRHGRHAIPRQNHPDEVQWIAGGQA